MSASASASESKTNTATNTAQQTVNATGAHASPTVSGNANTTTVTEYSSDPEVAKAAISGIGTVAGQSLTTLAGANTNALSVLADLAKNQGNTDANAITTLATFAGNQQSQQAAASDQTTQLLSSVLANNQTLAANQQTGGLATLNKTYVTLGLLALGALAIVAFLFRKQ